MSSRFDKDDDRHYKNSYEDYDAAGHGNFVNPDECDVSLKMP